MADLMRELGPVRDRLHGDLELRRRDRLLGRRPHPQDLDTNIAGRHVLVVEDIIDSGLTLSYLMRSLKARKPASLEICALLTKPERREIDVPVKFVGFEIPNKFVIGYGLDFAERYRNLPYVAVLHPDLIPAALTGIRRPWPMSRRGYAASRLLPSMTL